MDLALTEDQAMIRESAQSYLADASNSAAVRNAMASQAGYDAGVWQTIAGELGWCGIAIDEAHGGLGYSTDYPVERLFRDTRGGLIPEGTSEIQTLIIGREVLGISAFT